MMAMRQLIMVPNWAPKGVLRLGGSPQEVKLQLVLMRAMPSLSPASLLRAVVPVELMHGVCYVWNAVACLS